MTNQEVTVVQENNIANTVANSPMQAYQMLLNNGGSLEHIEKMLELQERFDAMNAKKAFTVAMAAFKADPPIIKKDKVNNQYKSRYTSLGHLIDCSLPKMSAQGISHKWNVTQNDKTITVECIVTHRDGHSESVRMTAPPDGSGSKNPIQQIKSTITYLKAVTFESAMGLASTDANLDDDGNESNVPTITEKQLSQIVDMINATDTDEKAFLKWLNVGALEHIPCNLFNKAMTALKSKVKS